MIYNKKGDLLINSFKDYVNERNEFLAMQKAFDFVTTQIDASDLRKNLVAGLTIQIDLVSQRQPMNIKEVSNLELMKSTLESLDLY